MRAVCLNISASTGTNWESVGKEVTPKARPGSRGSTRVQREHPGTEGAPGCRESRGSTPVQREHPGAEGAWWDFQGDLPPNWGPGEVDRQDVGKEGAGSECKKPSPGVRCSWELDEKPWVLGGLSPLSSLGPPPLSPPACLPTTDSCSYPVSLI